jgi:hypothetical protein
MSMNSFPRSTLESSRAPLTMPPVPKSPGSGDDWIPAVGAGPVAVVAGVYQALLIAECRKGNLTKRASDPVVKGPDDDSVCSDAERG